jgi:hypothetical protein
MSKTGRVTEKGSNLNAAYTDPSQPFSAGALYSQPAICCFSTRLFTTLSFFPSIDTLFTRSRQLRLHGSDEAI